MASAELIFGAGKGLGVVLRVFGVALGSTAGASQVSGETSKATVAVPGNGACSFS